MKAYKCDRCGQLYESMCNPDIWVTQDFQPYSEKKKYNLCDNCRKELKQWMTKYNNIKRYNSLND